MGSSGEYTPDIIHSCNNLQEKCYVGVNHLKLQLEVVLTLAFITDLSVLNQRALFPMMALNSNAFKT